MTHDYDITHVDSLPSTLVDDLAPSMTYREGLHDITLVDLLPCALGDEEVDDVDSADAADTLRFIPIAPDATSIYDITPLAVRRLDRAAVRRRLIRATLQDIARLREAVAAGWDIGPELAYEERRLSALESAS